MGWLLHMSWDPFHLFMVGYTCTIFEACISCLLPAAHGLHAGLPQGTSLVASAAGPAASGTLLELPLPVPAEAEVLP